MRAKKVRNMKRSKGWEGGDGEVEEFLQGAHVELAGLVFSEEYLTGIHWNGEKAGKIGGSGVFALSRALI